MQKGKGRGMVDYSLSLSLSLFSSRRLSFPVPDSRFRIPASSSGLSPRLQPDPDSERRELIAPFMGIHEREGEPLDVVRHAGADESRLHLQPGLAREARVVRSHAVARRV